MEPLTPRLFAGPTARRTAAGAAVLLFLALPLAGCTDGSPLGGDGGDGPAPPAPPDATCETRGFGERSSGRNWSWQARTTDTINRTDVHCWANRGLFPNDTAEFHFRVETGGYSGEFEFRFVDGRGDTYAAGRLGPSATACSTRGKLAATGNWSMSLTFHNYSAFSRIGIRVQDRPLNEPCTV